MKARTIALLWLTSAVLAAAQTAPPSQRVAPQAKPAAAPTAAPRPSSTFKPPKPAAAQPATAAAKPQAAPVKPAVAKAKPKPAGAVQKAALRAPKAPAKRDPFVSPVMAVGGPAGPACSTGKKCLAIDTIVLRGIVKSQVGMIAVVESSTRRVTYFLRENDPVFNGYVVKITFDSVVFRENVIDNLGQQSTRDVVMKVVAPVV